MAPQKHDFGISDQGELWGNPLGHIGGPHAQIPSRIDAEVAEPEITYFMNCADESATTAADVTADEPAVPACGNADDTQIEAPEGAHRRRRARPHKARAAQRSDSHSRDAPSSPDIGASRGADD